MAKRASRPRGKSCLPAEAPKNRRVLPGKELQPTISVDRLIESFPDLQITILAGASGTGRTVGDPRIQKPGLALAGVVEILHPERVQILGSTELAFLERKTPAQRRGIAEALCGRIPCCLLLTKGLTAPKELLRAAAATGTPLLATPHTSSAVVSRLDEGLADLLAPVISTHGVLMSVYGVGLLLVGPGSIGKSECALDLLVRGHRLISDDIVEIRRRGDLLIGTAPELLRHHMELRGLGIIDIKELFGVVATRREKDVDLVVELEAWKEGRNYDRLGLDDQFIMTLGLPLPYILLPVAPGRNIAILLEVAVRNLLLKRKGIHSAQDFARRLHLLLGTEPDET